MFLEVVLLGEGVGGAGGVVAVDEARELRDVVELELADLLADVLGGVGTYLWRPDGVRAPLLPVAGVGLVRVGSICERRQVVAISHTIQTLIFAETHLYFTNIKTLT